MPDLNLIEEEGAEPTQGGEESFAPAEGMEEEGGNKLVKILIVVVAVGVLGGGGYFLLKKLGVIGGKKAPTTIVQQVEEPAAAEGMQPAAGAQGADSSQMKLVETPALEQKGKAGRSEKGEKQTAKMAATLPTATASVAGKKAADMKGAYTIQVSAFRDQNQAEAIRQRLEEAGYPAFLETREHKDGTWYTVRIGRYPSRKVAEKAVADFALELRSNYWVDRIKSH